MGPSPPHHQQAFHHQPATPFSPAGHALTMGGALGQPVIGPEVQLSGKHDGLALYLSRLMRPLWNGLILEEKREWKPTSSVKVRNKRE